jgi:hypothetical protein
MLAFALGVIQKWRLTGETDWEEKKTSLRPERVERAMPQDLVNFIHSRRVRIIGTRRKGKHVLAVTPEFIGNKRRRVD